MRTVAARDRDAIGMTTDLNYAFSLGSQFRPLLNTPRASQNLQRATDAILSDLAPHWIEIRMAVSWLIQTGRFRGMDYIESPTIKRIKLSILKSDLSTVFSGSAVQGMVAFLSGYLGLEFRDACALTDHPLHPGQTSSSHRGGDEAFETANFSFDRHEAGEICRYLPAPPLQGDALFDEITRLGDIGATELAVRCGYYKRHEDGSLSANLTGFYQSLLLAKFRRINPSSKIISWPAKVERDGCMVLINELNALQVGLADGYYQLASKSDWEELGYFESIILTPLSEYDSEEWSRFMDLHRKSEDSTLFHR
jgi:hypothetical protein